MQEFMWSSLSTFAGWIGRVLMIVWSNTGTYLLWCRWVNYLHQSFNSQPTNINLSGVLILRSAFQTFRECNFWKAKDDSTYLAFPRTSLWMQCRTWGNGRLRWIHFFWASQRESHDIYALQMPARGEYEWTLIRHESPLLSRWISYQSMHNLQPSWSTHSDRALLGVLRRSFVTIGQRL